MAYIWFIGELYTLNNILHILTNCHIFQGNLCLNNIWHKKNGFQNCVGNSRSIWINKIVTNLINKDQNKYTVSMYTVEYCFISLEHKNFLDLVGIKISKKYWTYDILKACVKENMLCSVVEFAKWACANMTTLKSSSIYDFSTKNAILSPCPNINWPVYALFLKKLKVMSDKRNLIFYSIIWKTKVGKIHKKSS